MPPKQLHNRLLGWFSKALGSDYSGTSAVRRGSLTHVIILDGTMSSLARGQETNAGLTYRLLQEVGADLSLYYQAGVQWRDWHTTLDVMMGHGIDQQIKRAYGYLSSRFRPGDRIFLLGYSRGAFAVRSLAGVIDRVGLLRRQSATERNIRTAYRHYKYDTVSRTAQKFSMAHCHEDVSVEMVGAWDTVKALGLRLPLLWRLTEGRHAYHNHQLSPVVKHGYHALALDETREVFSPVLWECSKSWDGRVEQVWFRGAHGDIGGHLGDFHAARPLANISLIWMLQKLQKRGVSLPRGWQDRFETDAKAPMVGTWRSWGRVFLFRQSRVVGCDRSESIHPTARPFVDADVLKAFLAPRA